MKIKNPARSQFGLIALSIVFLLLYGYFNTLGARPQNIPANNQTETTGNSVTLGTLGGFHLLESFAASDERTAYRISIQTRLNRSTLIDQSIKVPHTKVEQLAGTVPVWRGGRYRSTEDFGPYRLQVTLSDTSPTDQTNGEGVRVFQGPTTLNINQSPLTKIQLIENTGSSISQLIVGLDKEVKFRTSSTPTGTIYIDILK